MSNKVIKRKLCDNAPLSVQQKNIWMEHELYPDNVSYNMVSCLRLSGDLNVEAFKKSLNEIVLRNETFRTTFSVSDSEPHQTIHPYVAASVSETALSTLSAKEQEAEIQRAIQRETQLPFDLENGPLFRFALLSLNKDEHVFLMTVHHIVMDGWSMGIFANELSMLYEAFCDDKLHPLSETGIQYSDYAVWQNEEYEESKEKDAKYWVGVINDAVFGEFPTDYPRVFGKKGESATKAVTIPADLTEKLKSFSRQERTTLFVALMAGFQVVLHRYTGHENLISGYTISGRDQGETRNLLGQYSNLTAIKTAFSGDPDFRKVLKRTHRAIFDTFEHGYMLLSNLSAYQTDEGSLNSILFPVVFNFQNFQYPEWKLCSLEIKPESVATDTARFDMEISVVPVKEELEITVQYRKDLYSGKTAERILNHYRNILSSAISNPDQPIHKLSMMIPAEIRQIVEDWNSEKAAYPTDSTIHQLIGAAAKENPDAVALTYKEQNISYQELINRSNHAARVLVEMGVGPEVMVGVCMERSHNLIITLLAILKAGGVYVPLDPIYPDEKLTFMLENSNAPVLLAGKDQFTKFPDYAGKIIEIETLFSQLKTNEAIPDLPHANISSENSAYMIYTSGSTGKPKGVLVTHRNVVNSFCFMNIYIDDADSSRTWLFSTSISFDPSVLEMFWTLSRGYRVVILPDKDSGKFLDIDAVPELLQKHHVSHFQCTPSVLRVLTDRDDGFRALKQLTKLMIGGECFPVALAKRLSAEAEIDIYNVYGPTETTLWATWYRFQKDDEYAPVGRPLPNYEIYILDGYLQPVPIGVYGEVCIGGDGVARGYFNDTELTAKKYIPFPFNSHSGDRIYRTGDIARYRADGIIEFLGRADRQVKIRGHRIELGEVESAIMDFGKVRETVVIVTGNTGIDQMLLGYVIPDFDSAGAGELDSFKKERLNGWQTLWNQTYCDVNSIAETAFNTAGWNSVYTNQPIPPEEMREWVEATVDRIRSLCPRRVLEIGCGTGLLLYRLAPICERYYATDASAFVIESLNSQIEKQELSHVSLSHRMAHDFSGLESNYFDTIILNSVIQYFPSVSYLRNILENAIRLLSPGGRIFLGDVRNFDLLGCMYTSVEITRASSQLTLRELRSRVKFAVENERELAISPDWFRSLFRQFANIGEIDIQLKRGNTTNEINQFRYDVTLHLDQKRNIVPEKILQWRKDVSSIQDIVNCITQQPDDLFKIVNIPYARLLKEQIQWQKLNDLQTRNIRELTTVSCQNDKTTLEDFWKLEDEFPCYAVIDYGKNDPFTVEVGVFPKNHKWISIADCIAELRSDNYDRLATDPLWPVMAHNLKKNLREALDRKLPGFMIPANLTVLKEFPKLSNGKIDRKSLPLLEVSINDDAGLKSVLSPAESTLMEIWEDVLGIDGFGITDSFIDIGGNSLSAVIIINRIKTAFNIKIAIKDFLGNSTIKQLARLVDRQIENVVFESSDDMPSINRNEDIPLSSFQESRLRYELSMDIGNVPYLHVSAWFSIRLTGNLDREALEKAFNYIIYRHEVFRTVFWPEINEVSPSTDKWNSICQFCRINPRLFLPKLKFKQSVQSSVTMSLNYYDVSEYGEEKKDSEIKIIADDTIERRYIYESPPLTRAALIRKATAEHILIVAASHLIADAISMRIYEKELAFAYNSLVDKQPINLPDPELQYVDYVAWLKHRLETGSLDSVKSYWQKQFDGYVPTDVTILPFTDVEGSKNDPDFSIETKYYNHLVADELSGAIRKYAGSVNMTPFTISLTGFVLCLYNESGKDDIGVLTFFANRTRPEMENTIGMLVNGNIVRVKINADDSFYKCASAVSERLDGALKNQELMALPPDLRLKKSPYDFVAYRPITCESLMDEKYASFSGLDVEKIIMGRDKSEYALRLFVVDSGMKMSLLFQYNLDLFNCDDIKRIAKHTENIMRKIITNPFGNICNT